MRVMAIDASSVCSGIVVAEIDNKGEVSRIGSASIIPKKFSPTLLGYKASKANINGYKSYVKKGENFVSKTEAKRRNAEVRHARNDFKAKTISSQLNTLISKISPDIVVIEKNRTFNSVLTTALLAEVMGCVEGVCGANDIDLIKVTVEAIRKELNAPKLVKEFCEIKTVEELSSYEDITKEAIKDYLEYIYNFRMANTDEGDACAVFHYYYKNLYRLGEAK